jgi:NTP pyrophosphatase (non-canonical NTP hydrolase)
MSKSITEWAREVHSLAVSKGWHLRPMRDDAGTIDPDAIGAKLMLIVSEVAEALEELRVMGSALHMRDRDDHNNPCKPEGFDVELADTVIRILDLAEALGLDIEKAMEVKHAYNRDKRGYRHGGKTL